MLTTEDKNKILELKYNYSFYAPWSDAALFHTIIENLVEPFKKVAIDKVLGLEARGFILGAPVAYVLNTGFVVVRKAGNLYKGEYSPSAVLQETCIDYTGAEKILEIETHEKGVQKGDRVLIIDDWFERGGQGQAAIKLVERAGGIVVGVAIMIDSMTDDVKKAFDAYNFHTLIKET